jgi:hypothetical protein
VNKRVLLLLLLLALRKGSAKSLQAYMLAWSPTARVEAVREGVIRMVRASE